MKELKKKKEQSGRIENLGFKDRTKNPGKLALLASQAEDSEIMLQSLLKCRLVHQVKTSYKYMDKIKF